MLSTEPEVHNTLTELRHIAVMSEKEQTNATVNTYRNRKFCDVRKCGFKIHKRAETHRDIIDTHVAIHTHMHGDRDNV